MTLEETNVETAALPPAPRSGALVWVASALGIGIVVGAIAMRSLTDGADPSPPSVVRFDIRVPETNSGHLPSVMTITPDESEIVFVRELGETQQLYRRSLAGDDLVPIDGTIGGSAPFFSPDGEWLGFHADGQLKKVLLDGGLATALCDLPVAIGATWGDNNRIVYASASSW